MGSGYNLYNRYHSEREKSWLCIRGFSSCRHALLLEKNTLPIGARLDEALFAHDLADTADKSQLDKEIERLSEMSDKLEIKESRLKEMSFNLK